MFKYLRLALLISLAFALGACNISFNTSNILGSGTIVTETPQVSGFSQVFLGGIGDVTIDQTGTESLTIVTDDNIYKELDINVSGNRLEIKPKPNTNLNPSKGIQIKITVKDLTWVGIGGSANIRVTGIAPAEFTADIGGSGSIVAEGKADKQRVTIGGSGRFDGEKLTGMEATVELGGSGEVTVNVSDKLTVNIGGSGVVKYLGSPAVTQNIGGSGRVEKKN